MFRSASQTRLFPSKLGIGLVAVVAAVTMSLSACSVNPQPTKYGDDYKDNFMLGCTGVDPKTDEVPYGGELLASNKQCECVYNGLVEKVPFDEAKKFEEDQAKAASGADIEVPDNIAKIFAGCEGA